MEETYHLKHNGEIIFTGTHNECFIRLLRVQGQSTHYALTYGGYSIVPVSKENQKKED